MHRFHVIWIVIVLIVLSGCASLQPKEVGYFIGNVAGMLLGGTPGAAAGSLLGVAVGQMIDRQIDKQQEQKERTVLTERITQTPGDPEQGSKARLSDVERVWVDEQMVDGHLIPGHFESRPIRLEVSESRGSLTSPTQVSHR